MSSNEKTISQFDEHVVHSYGRMPVALKKARAEDVLTKTALNISTSEAVSALIPSATAMRNGQMPSALR